MTNSALNDVFGADFYGAFVDAGMADEGVFTPKGGTPVDCLVMVDLDVSAFQRLGVDYVKNTALVRMLKQGITPRPKERDTITVGSDVFEIERRVDGGENEVEWVFLCRV